MNISDMDDKLSKLYDDISAGKVSVVKARELNNTVQNLQASIRLQLLQCRMRNEVPDLPFFKSSNKDTV